MTLTTPSWRRVVLFSFLIAKVSIKMSKEKNIVKFDHAEAIHVALIDHKTDKTCI